MELFRSEEMSLCQVPTQASGAWEAVRTLRSAPGGRRLEVPFPAAAARRPFAYPPCAAATAACLL